MKRTLMIILSIGLLLGLTTYTYITIRAGFPNMVDLSDSHLGQAVLKEPGRSPLEDVYTVSDFSPLKGYGAFNRELEVYGLTLIVHKDISDDFALKVANTMVSMFPKDPAFDLESQERLLQNMHLYKAALPLVKNERAMGDTEKLQRDYSICDIIMQVNHQQENEVIEHLLHAITDVGLHYTYNESWGLEGSDLQALMKQAIESKYYNIEDYKSYPSSVKNRILVQEYAYWAITSVWDFQATYGQANREWVLDTYDKIARSQGKFITLYNRTLKTILQPPTQTALDAFKK